MIKQGDNISEYSLEEVGYQVMDHDGADSSDEESTSSNSSESTPEFPLLVPFESANLSVLVTAFNATETLNGIFRNHGEDLVPLLRYDPEWYRRFLEPFQRPESNEEQWRLAVRTELQILNAFLDGNFSRSIASTANLESLLRLKISSTDEPHIEISTIFKLLVDIPEIHNSIMQFAEIDGSSVAVLPIPIELEDYWGGLQKAADRIFWPNVVNYTEGSKPDINEIPILDNLCDVVIIQCQQPDVEPDERIWPERYTKKYRDVVLNKWKEKQESYNAMKELESELESRLNFGGRTVSESVETTVSCLKMAGLESAADEIHHQLSLLEDETAKLRSKLSELKRVNENNDHDPIVPVDHSDMTPYELKALIPIDNDVETNTVITRSFQNYDEWHYAHGSTTRILEWSDVTYTCQKSENYLAIYERKKSYPRHDISASIRKYAAEDSTYISQFGVTNSSSSEDSSSDVEVQHGLEDAHTQ